MLGLLKRNTGYRRLWLARSSATLGVQITTLLFQLLAADRLGATASQVGLLGFVLWGPFIVLGLWAGIVIDRRDKGPVIGVSEVARVAALGAAGGLYLTGHLGIVSLLALALVVGCATVFADVAYASAMPFVVDRSDLLEGNSKMMLSEGVARTAGPGAASTMLAGLGGGVSLLLNGVAYAVAGTIGRGVHTDVPAEGGGTVALRGWRAVAEGLRFARSRPAVLRMVLLAVVINLSAGVLFMSGAHVLLATRELEFDAGVVGVLLGLGALGTIPGALLADRVAKRLGVVRALVVFVTVFSLPLVSWAFLPAGPVSMPLFSAAYLLATFGFAATQIASVSVVQAVTPRNMLARVSGITRIVTWGVLPFGALLGGVLGDVLGPRGVVAVGGAGILLALVSVVGRGLRPAADIVTADQALRGLEEPVDGR